MFYAIDDIIRTFLSSFRLYLPNLFGGIIILAIGLIIAQILRKVLASIFDFFKFDLLVKKTGLASGKGITVWRDLLIELLGWAVVIIFLIPAVEVWGLSQVTIVLNQLLFYLPNVLAAVIIGFIGLIFANLASDVVRHGVTTIGATSAKTLSVLARYSIIFFTILIVLSQLGIAQDLIRILFTGIVAMIAIAGGLAFGLGGKDLAREMLEELRKNVT